LDHPEESTLPLCLSPGEMGQVIFRKSSRIPGRDQEVCTLEFPTAPQNVSNKLNRA
jgi:hypothetical protein